MRRVCLTCAAAFAMVVAAPMMPAHAVIPVTCDNCSQFIEQIQEFAKTIANMEQQYQMTSNIFQSLTRMVDPNNIAQTLLGQQQPMPGTADINSILQGKPSAGLASIIGAFRQGDMAYQPTGSDPTANMLMTNATALSGIKALAMQQINSIQSHVAGLETLRQQLSAVQSQADLTAIQGRIQAEQADLQAQGVQAQSVQTAMQLQAQIRDQQQLQVQRQGADQLFADTAPLSGAGGGTTTGAAGAPVADTSTIPTFAVAGGG